MDKSMYLRPFCNLEDNNVDMNEEQAHWKELERFQKTYVWKLVRASDQSIIDRQGTPLQILLVAGLIIVLFTSNHSYKFYECSRWTV